MSQTTAERRHQLQNAHKPLLRFPTGEYFELPGRPNVIYTIADYGRIDNGIEAARREVPFLFKAFETGQARPPRPGSKAAEEPRASTIHEYLDWTVTAAAGGDAEDDLDFSGFRTVLLVPRFRPSWPPPGVFDSEAPKQTAELGAPRCPLPLLLPKSKPVSAATVRAGPGYLEVPFFATHDSHRNQGFGRALLEALEDLARACGLPRLLLCSTDDPLTYNTWRHLGFVFTQASDLEAFDVHHGDLLHMDNTRQMHKTVPPARPWKSIVIRHDQWAQRAYYPPTPDPLTGALLDSVAQHAHAQSGQEDQTGWVGGSMVKRGLEKVNGDLAGAGGAEKRRRDSGSAGAGPEAGTAQAPAGRGGDDATELTEATDITTGEPANEYHHHQYHKNLHTQHQGKQAAVVRSNTKWKTEGLEVTGPAHRWRIFTERGTMASIAIAIPH